jgi:hypothetical protein
MTNGVPILGQGPGGAPSSPGDPTYYILTQWFHPQNGQGGPMEVMGYAPKMHGRPSQFGPPHVLHVKQLVKESLAQQGVLGVEVIITFMWRYETQPSPLVDLHGGSRN